MRDPFVKELLPDSHNTLSTWTKKYYPFCKDAVRTRLSQCTSRITLSFHGWKSSSDMDPLGVIANDIDKEYKCLHVLPALTSTYGSYAGVNLIERLLHVIQDYRLGSSIGYYIADGASNNDKAIELLGHYLQVEPRKQRLRYAALINNLVCKAILLGVDTDCIEDVCQDTAALSPDDEDDDIDATIYRFEGALRDEKAALIAWRKKGLVGKLHNLVRHVKASPAHHYYFESKQREVERVLPVYKLVTDGGVRWNSTHDMIDRGLEVAGLS